MHSLDNGQHPLPLIALHVFSLPWLKEASERCNGKNDRKQNFGEIQALPQNFSFPHFLFGCTVTRLKFTNSWERGSRSACRLVVTTEIPSSFGERGPLNINQQEEAEEEEAMHHMDWYAEGEASGWGEGKWQKSQLSPGGLGSGDLLPPVSGKAQR